MACQPAATTDLVASPLAGAAWQIVAIDGARPVAMRSDEGGERSVRFTFGWRSYGGNAGCNALGGLYAQVGERLYTMPGPQTAMACGGRRAAQEDAVNAILLASPQVRSGEDGIALVGGGHTMALRRLATAAPMAEPPAAWQGPGVARQSYVVQAVDGVPTGGRRIWGETPPRLRFSDTMVTMLLDCPRPASARFAMGTEILSVLDLSASCRTAGTRDAALAAILSANPRTVSGPNGELLLASARGWAILWNERRDRPK